MARKRRRHSLAQMRRRLESWRASGLSLKDWAKSEGIAYQTRSSLLRLLAERCFLVLPRTFRFTLGEHRNNRFQVSAFRDIHRD